MNEQAIEQEIQDKGLTAARVTPESVDATITGEDYHVFPGTTLTVCCLHLKNGFTVTGERASRLDAAAGITPRELMPANRRIQCVHKQRREHDQR